MVQASICDSYLVLLYVDVGCGNGLETDLLLWIPVLVLLGARRGLVVNHVLLLLRRRLLIGIIGRLAAKVRTAVWRTRLRV